MDYCSRFVENSSMNDTYRYISNPISRLVLFLIRMLIWIISVTKLRIDSLFTTPANVKHPFKIKGYILMNFAIPWKNPGESTGIILIIIIIIIYFLCMTIFSATPNNIALYNNVTSVGIFHWLLTVIYQRHMASADLFRCLFFHVYVFLTYR